MIFQFSHSADSSCIFFLVPNLKWKYFKSFLKVLQLMIEPTFWRMKSMIITGNKADCFDFVLTRQRISRQPAILKNHRFHYVCPIRNVKWSQTCRRNLWNQLLSSESGQFLSFCFEKTNFSVFLPYKIETLGRSTYLVLRSSKQC